MRFVPRLLTTLLLLAGAETGHAGDSPLFGGLAAGSHEVGFTLVETRDMTRTGPDQGVQAPSPRGRPLRVWIWYPAKETELRDALPFSRYAKLMDGDFSPGVARTERSDFAAGPLARSLPAERLRALLETRTRAFEAAPPATGRHPLIALAQGLYYESPITHAILCEYLASHGFVVATCPLVGTWSRLIDLDPEHLETQARDMEYIIALARERSDVDGERLGLVGFDMGGMTSLILAMRNPDVDALVSLDAGILYPHPSGIPVNSPHYDPSRLLAPWLHITQRDAVADPAASGSLFETAVYSERTLILAEGMRHCDLTSFAMIEGKAPVPGYWQDSVGDPRPKYEAVCREVLRFFQTVLLGDRDARRFLERDPAGVAAPGPLSFAHHAARPAPPTVGEFCNTLSSSGFEAAAGLVREAMKSHPDCELVREQVLNRLGYQFLYFWGHSDVAVDIFQLMVEIYPESSNAHDSL
ncbi:MAG: alpha/beta fold hydrolase, partial [Planctomycetota bacterium]